MIYYFILYIIWCINIYMCIYIQNSTLNAHENQIKNTRRKVSMYDDTSLLPTDAF